MTAVRASTASSQGSNGQESKTASSVWPMPSSLRCGPRRWHVRGPQADHEVDQGVHLGRPHLLAVSRHVSAARRAVADLVNELVAGKPPADGRQVWAARAADALQ